MVTLTPDEYAALTPAEQKAHLALEEKIVFGVDHQKQRGKPVENGIGRRDMRRLITSQRSKRRKAKRLPIGRAPQQRRPARRERILSGRDRTRLRRSCASAADSR